jgi:hypothetical protein
VGVRSLDGSADHRRHAFGDMDAHAPSVGHGSPEKGEAVRASRAWRFPPADSDYSATVRS